MDNIFCKHINIDRPLVKGVEQITKTYHSFLRKSFIYIYTYTYVFFAIHFVVLLSHYGRRYRGERPDNSSKKQQEAIENNDDDAYSSGIGWQGFVLGAVMLVVGAAAGFAIRTK